VTHSQPSSS
jgi:KUP system potassium uptake protein